MTKQHIAQIDAASFQEIREGRAALLHNMTARLYDASGLCYRQISSEQAVVDEKLGTLAYGPKLETVVKLVFPKS